ncbi:MAG: hypothetical protein GXY44_07025, partial [Phycisphaerales bacterium]|nr:hypothetical protein [Phycisphaerales bacterium]
YPDLQTVRPQRLRPFLTKALKVFGDERYRNWLDKLPDDDPDSTEKKAPEAPGPTAVDDVRRLRERLSAEFDGDVRRLAEHAERVVE